jgi:ABC-type histidine transport system ATPase subunit
LKKIDLHIHTHPSAISDSHFEFCPETLKEYVKKLEIDCIAITNHNLFDRDQFEFISSILDITVFPGIEIDLVGGHLLLISGNTELVDFESKCKQIGSAITTKGDSISVEIFKTIFPDLSRYLLIPHYDKRPIIAGETLTKLQPHISAGEVSSARKFLYCLKDVSKLTPVIFSDARICKVLSESFPTRQTFVDLIEVTIGGLKSCFTDKAKVSLSKNEGNEYFQVTDDGLYLSTGLNVILGERSSGKTFTLERIKCSFENVKYIQQFSLLQNDEEKFEKLLATRHSTVNEQFFKEFKNVVSDIKNVDLIRSKTDVEKYLASLIKFASESDKQDSFSKATLFSESTFVEANLTGLEKLIAAVVLLIENAEFRVIIDRHLSITTLRGLALDLVSRYTEISEANLKYRWLNDLITKVKGDLKLKTSITQPAEINFYDIVLDNEKVKKFKEVVSLLQKEREIDRKEIRGFKVIAKTKRFTGAQQFKNISRRQLSFTNAFAKYNEPYSFLNLLKELALEETEFYKYFVDIEYKTLNRYDFPVSGGERSEFNLLHEIGDALQYDMLLIDEPESSFDNLFLKNEVNDLLKEISKEIPVVIVTHNSTVGASIKPDFIVYNKKVIVNGRIKYQTFYGYPSDKLLKSIDGEQIDNYDIMLCCLEAGSTAYNDRRINSYEVLKN